MYQKFCDQLTNGQKKTCSPPLSGQKFITYTFLNELRKKKKKEKNYASQGTRRTNHKFKNL
jgi:hypothetical protein